MNADLMKLSVWINVTISIGGSDNLQIEKDTFNWESVKVSWKFSNLKWKPCIMRIIEFEEIDR